MENPLKDQYSLTNFNAIQISIASKEEIKSWSYGEVTKPETINYRTQKPEREGLFDEKIFGPVKDFECYCGKYRKIRYKGIVCDKCGVEVTTSKVRRYRMGHINLAIPIAHIWYVRGLPSILGQILDLSVRDLEKVIYFSGYIVLEVNEEIKKQALNKIEKEWEKEKSQVQDEDEKLEIDLRFQKEIAEIKQLKPLSILSDTKYHEYSLGYGRLVKVGIGAEAILQLLRKIDLDQEIKTLSEISKKATGVSWRKALTRMRLFHNLKKAKIRPEWMILEALPVLPPDLRPMVQLDGGRFAASDLNDLYRRVINRNNRLKKLITQDAPEVICRNEKRMLQEAVDALVDNAATKGRGVTTTSGRRKLRSLSDMLRGKQGRFRQNLLGKRVDYSGRSVIVVGPELRFNQCGLPKTMALELFKPFVISRLIREGYAHNVKMAQRLVEKSEPFVWDILEEITKNHYVLLNRAPTLHRLGIQAFLPVLIEGKAISIHPLVCSAYNADFDGDQMAVHVPLSDQARWEAENIMRSSYNILKPASGDPIVTPSNDMILGCYYLTSEEAGQLGEGKIFGSEEEAINAHDLKIISLRALIKVKINGKVAETTVGRIIFNRTLPSDLAQKLGFLNEAFNKKAISRLVAQCFTLFGQSQTAELIDKLKDLGFHYAGQSGITISISDIHIPKRKNEIVQKADERLKEVESQYQDGLITETEKYEKSVEIWTTTKSEIEKEMISEFHQYNPVAMIVNSGSRGSVTQLTQIAGMKGLVVNPAGEIIELPVRSNFKEGFSAFEYFISTHGARKGRADTALRTSDAGYLTRRLIDVAQDIVVTSSDCGAEGILVTRAEDEEMGLQLKQRIKGRFLTKNVAGFKGGVLITAEIAQQIDEKGIKEVWIRSPLLCKNSWGICQKCYGEDLARSGVISLGEAVGIIAAQAIGEPGTQLTMRTFHIGGIVGEDITQGLPRVEELFEARSPRFLGTASEIDGKVKVKETKDEKIIEVISSDYPVETIDIKDYHREVKNKEKILPKQIVATSYGEKAKRAEVGGIVEIKGTKLIIKSKEPLSKIYRVPAWISLRVLDKDLVLKGQPLTEGHLDIRQMMKLIGREKTARYIIKETQAIYASQGQTINEKHIELIIRQMFSRAKVLDPKDSEYMPGQIVDRYKIIEFNESYKKKNKPAVTYEDLILGITRVSLTTDSFLSSASFQETTSVLIQAAIRGSIDPLKGLKENVIIGRLIPAGTGFKRNVKAPAFAEATAGRQMSNVK